MRLLVVEDEGGIAGALRQGWALPGNTPPELPVLQSALAQQALALPQPQAGSSTR